MGRLTPISPLILISLSTVAVVVAATVAFVVAVAVAFVVAAASCCCCCFLLSASCFLLPAVASGERPPFELRAHWHPLTSVVVPFGGSGACGPCCGSGGGSFLVPACGSCGGSCGGSYGSLVMVRGMVILPLRR